MGPYFVSSAFPAIRISCRWRTPWSGGTRIGGLKDWPHPSARKMLTMAPRGALASGCPMKRSVSGSGRQPATPLWVSLNTLVNDYCATLCA
jgi:hypothetical protein